jgi:hypothetical protein
VDIQVAERRIERRLSGSTFRMLYATLRPGCPVLILDLSQTGAQVETDRPLRPGTRVHVRLVAEDWSLVAAAVVLRCAVWALNPQEGVTYRGALRFEAGCKLPAPCSRG